MLRILQTFNDHEINDGDNYDAWLLNPYAQPAAQNIFVAQANADSEDAGTYSVSQQNLVVRIKIKNYTNRRALIAQLQSWFKRGTQGDLVVLYDDDGLTYFKTSRVVNLVQDSENAMYFDALLQTGFSTWRAVQADTYTWNLTGTGDNHTLTLAGDDETPLSASFTISAGPSNGYLFQRFYQLLNAPQTVLPLGWGPWCITMDTASLIADNSNKCQINQGGGIDASVTTIPYDTVTGSIPNAGSGYVDSEQISWTGKTGTTSGNLTGVTRHVGGTSPASHADNAVIKVSYIQANCADVRVFIDGVEAKRWIANPNNASTLIWFNVMLNTGYALSLKTAIASSGDISVIEFAVTPNTLNALTAMPEAGILVHGTEWIKYQGKDLVSYRLNVVQRGVLSTTKQAHAAGDTFSFMEHVITVCYGNMTSVAPGTLDTTYDDTKPLFLLASSSNSSWVYDATTLFYDTALSPTDPAHPDRTGGFKPAILARLGKDSKVYYTKQNVLPTADPALGMTMRAIDRGTYYVADQASLAWSFYRGCGIDTSTFTGQKYRGGNSFPAIAALQNSVDGANYISVWNEATPGSAEVWTALGSHSSVDMGDACWMRFLFSGSVAAGSAENVWFEILTGTINFVSANLPTGTLLSQQANAQLELVLSNGANEDALSLSIAMLPLLALELDGELKTVLYHKTNAYDVMRLNDEGRDVWIRLQTGDNVLTIVSADLGTLAVDLSWYRRRA